MFIQALWKSLETVHYWWRRTGSSPLIVVCAVTIAVVGMLFPLFQTASITLECHRVEPNEGMCKVLTNRLVGWSSITVSIQEISYAEAVVVDSTDDAGNPRTCWRVDLQLEDSRSVWLTSCHLGAGEAQRLRASINDFLSDKAQMAFVHYDSETSFLRPVLFEIGIALLVGTGILLLFRIVRQKKPTPNWRDKPTPTLLGTLFALGIGAACLAGIVGLAVNAFSYEPRGEALRPVADLVAIGIFLVCGIGAAGYLSHSVLAWIIFRQSVIEAPARVKRSSERTPDEYGEKHTKYSTN